MGVGPIVSKLTQQLLLLIFAAVIPNISKATMSKTGSFFFLFLALLATTCQPSFAWDGPIKTRNQQCKDAGYPGTCDWEGVNGAFDYGCLNLRCARIIGAGPKGPVYMPIYIGTVSPGTYCGAGKHCWHGRCRKNLPMNAPQYTGPETKINECN